MEGMKIQKGTMSGERARVFFFFLWALFYLLLRDVYDICLWKNSTVGKFE